MNRRAFLEVSSVSVVGFGVESHIEVFNAMKGVRV